MSLLPVDWVLQHTQLWSFPGVGVMLVMETFTDLDYADYIIILDYWWTLCATSALLLTLS